MRSFLPHKYGLAWCKLLLEIWGETQGHPIASEYKIISFDTVRNLCKVIGKVARDEWKMDKENMVFIQTQNISRSEIRGL